jgi:hypothetical protein
MMAFLKLYTDQHVRKYNNTLVYIKQTNNAGYPW